MPAHNQTSRTPSNRHRHGARSLPLASKDLPPLLKAARLAKTGRGVTIKLSRGQLLDCSRRVVDDQLMLLDDLLMLLDARSRLDIEFEIAEKFGRRKKSQTTDSEQVGRTSLAQTAWNAEQLHRLDYLIVFFLTPFEFKRWWVCGVLGFWVRERKLCT